MARGGQLGFLLFSIVSFQNVQLSFQRPQVSRRQAPVPSPFNVGFDRAELGPIPDGEFMNTGLDLSDFAVLKFKETDPPGQQSGALTSLKDNFLRPQSPSRYAYRVFSGVQEQVEQFSTTSFGIPGSQILSNSFDLSRLYFGCFFSIAITRGTLPVGGDEPVAPLIYPVDCLVNFQGIRSGSPLEGVAKKQWFFAKTPLDASGSLEDTVKISEMQLLDVRPGQTALPWTNLDSVEIKILAANLPAALPDSFLDSVTGVVFGVGGDGLKGLFGIALDSIQGTVYKAAEEA